MSTIVLDSLKGRDVLHTFGGLDCLKQAIYAVGGPTPRQLNGKNGVDNNTFVLPEGMHFSIGNGNCEVQPLSKVKKGVQTSTFKDLYDSDKPLTYENAKALAAERSVPVASPQAVEVVMQMFRDLNGGEIPQFDVSWYTSKGHTLAFRVPASVGEFYLPKPGWGATAIEEAKGDDVIVFNCVTREIYKIDRLQFAGDTTTDVNGQWFASAHPATKQDAFYDLIPVLTDEQIEAFQVFVPEGHDPKTVAQALLTEQRTELGLS